MTGKPSESMFITSGCKYVGASVGEFTVCKVHESSQLATCIPVTPTFKPVSSTSLLKNAIRALLSEPVAIAVGRSKNELEGRWLSTLTSLDVAEVHSRLSQ